jgi:hypothetical protein
MNRFSRRVAALAALASLGAINGTAAQTPDSVARRQQRTLDSLAAALRAMQARIDSLTRAGARPDTAATDELAALRAAAAAAAGDTAGQATGTVQAPRSQNALNPEITVTGDVRAGAFDPGPQVDNLFLRHVELGIQSALDPFSTAKIFVAFEDGEAHVEEAYAYYAGLPGHLRLDAGRFRHTFGELNRWHLHALPGDEYPLVIRRYAGDEGLAGTGLSLYWPLPFSGPAGTYELTVQATSGSNEVKFLESGRPAITAQLSGFWQLGRSTFAQLSISGLRGTSPDTSLTTTAGALAARFSWRPPDRATSSELTVRGELWVLRRKLALDNFDRTRLGGYADVSWRLSRRWIIGARGDYVQSPDPGPFGHEWAVTPALTFWQSEFVYVRTLLERSGTQDGPQSNRFGVQLVFAMGPHKHELF